MKTIGDPDRPEAAVRIPTTTSPSPRRRWAAVALAVIVAVLAALVAPEAWTSGPAVLSLRAPDRFSAEVSIDLGSDAAQTARLAAPDGSTWTLELPHGAPLTDVTRVFVRAVRDGAAVPLALDEVSLTLHLPDGRAELVPVLRATEGGALEAARRPPRHARFALALLGLVVVLWVTEALPLWVTSLLIPVALAGGGVTSARAALAPFFDPIIALFFGGFLLAEAMRRAGLDRRVACTLVARAARSPATLFAAFLGLSAFLSMWMSNTASTAILIPIALAVTAPLGNLGFRKTVVLGLAYAATIGGVGSAIGTPANPIAMRFLADYAGRPISFVGWFAFGLPIVVILLPAMGLYLWRRSHVSVDPVAFAAVRVAARAESIALGRMKRSECIVSTVLVLTMGLWLTQSLHGIADAVIALGAAVLLAALGIVRTVDLGRIAWPSLLTFGGGLALGVHLTDAGVADWIASNLAGLSGLPAWLGITVVAAATLGLTTVASNTATAAMLVPLALPLAGVLGVDPAQLVVTVAIASSLDFALVIGTPPTLFAYSTGLFTPGEIFRKGIVLDLIGLVVLVALAALVWTLVGLV